MRYNKIDKELFIENRGRYSSKMAAKTMAVFHSSDLSPRSGDQHHKFRQNPDIFYLSGIDQEETVLVLFPDHPDEKMREILYIKQTSEKIAIWEGHKYTMDEAKEASGINTIRWNSTFESDLAAMINLAEGVYVNFNENSRAVIDVPYKDIRFAQEIKNRYPGHAIYRSGPIMQELRAIKSPIEIELMQKACDITEKAFRRVLKFIKPGVWENEIEAEIIHEFISNKSNGHAYEPIVGSGKSACVLHYIENNRQCFDGDIVLMDFGADYANYAADLTRSVPVNGRFTERQKAVYNAVLHVMKEATNMLRPGTKVLEYEKEVGKIMTSELLGLGLLDKADVDNQTAAKPAYKKYFMHGTSHFLGIDVHDIGNRHGNMKEGMVFTCEPGIYILEEGLGIRLENDILVTSGDPKDLMASIPLEAEEIEEIMNA